MRVLVATTGGTYVRALTLRLAEACIPFDTAAVADVQDYLRSYDYDVLVLAGDGLATPLARLRRAGASLPVLAWASGEGPARTALFELGADDVVSPACEGGELVARLRALLRRSGGHAAPELDAGAAKLRIGSMQLLVRGRTVPLTPKEYAILKLLFLRRGVVHSKSSIVNHVYGAEDGPALRTLDVIVCKLRKKLAASGAPDLVATVWGSGLTLRDVPEAPQPAERELAAA